MYAPTEAASLSDAVIKIVGREVSSCCTIKALDFETPSGDEGGLDRKYYGLLAYFPKADSGMQPIYGLDVLN